VSAGEIPGTPLAMLDDVTLRVGRKHLFAHTTWEIDTDQHWAIIGPNGSGKSTLANSLFRRVAVVGGRVRYFFPGETGQVSGPRSYFNPGEIVRISPEDHQELLPGQGGYHQARWHSIEGEDSPTVSELLTGESIERFSRYQVGPTRVNERIYRARRQKAVALLGIDYLLGRRILHVSNGEARKVLIARALMQSPHLLILDDPFCGLDVSSREALKRAIEDLLAAGSPRLVLVAPRLDEIPRGITHVLCVAEGRVVAQGPRNEMLRPAFTREVFAPEDKDPHPPPEFPAAPGEPLPVDSILIDVSNTSVTYDGVSVLRDVDWTMRQGEHWAVLGPNGAGKTTLLSLILADNPQAYANEITLFGRKRGSGESIWEVKRRIGWVSPELQLYYRRAIACRHVVGSGFFDSVGLYRACSPEQTSAAARWMDALGIPHLADRPLGAVSAGEQRLVLLARALVKNPVLLVLDEPCQGLDPGNRARLIHLLEQLCRQTPVHLLYVTHHFEEMPDTITHVLELDQGRLRKSGHRRSVLGG